MQLRVLVAAGFLAAGGTALADPGPAVAFRIDGTAASLDRGALHVRRGQNVEIAVSGVRSSDIGWFRLLPVPLDYDNPSYCGSRKPCVQPIEYRTTEIADLKGRERFFLSEVPGIADPGAHELLVRAGGLEKRFQVAVRRDDTYVGYLTELLGVPFVYGPGPTAEGHQTDLRKGADCVALVIYGKRRQGEPIPYVAPSKLRSYADRIGDRDSVAGTAVREGDILHFGFQTAVVAEDKEPKGRLDDNDMIVHSYHGVAELRAFSRLPYRRAFFDILRWRR